VNFDVVDDVAAVAVAVDSCDEIYCCCCLIG